MYINPYSRIFNPATGRTVNVMSKVGKNVLKGYINELQGGYDQNYDYQDYYDDPNYDESQLGGYDDYDYKDYDENQLGGYDYYDDQNYDDQSQNNMNGGSDEKAVPLRRQKGQVRAVPVPEEPDKLDKLKEKITDWLGL